MLILVCGDRHWTDTKLIRDRLTQELVHDDPVITIMHGDARGADRIAGDVAKSLGYEVMAIPADWAQYGKGAGPIRNRRMLDRKPDLVIAFHDDLSKSRGTADTVREARKRGMKVEVIGHSQPPTKEGLWSA